MMNLTYDYQYIRMLRSSTAHLLQWPLVHTSVASRAFTVTVPTVWNSLSVNTRSVDSLLVLNADSNPNHLHLLTPLRTVQRYHNAPIRVLRLFYIFRCITLYKFSSIAYWLVFNNFAGDLCGACVCVCQYRFSRSHLLKVSLSRSTCTRSCILRSPSSATTFLASSGRCPKSKTISCVKWPNRPPLNRSWTW